MALSVRRQGTISRSWWIKLKKAVGPNRRLTEELIGIYREKVGREPDPTRAEGLLNEAFAPLVGKNAVGDVSAFLAEKIFVAERIKERAQAKLLFRQPSILLVYMLASKRPTDTANAWPLTAPELQPIYTDLGETAPM